MQIKTARGTYSLKLAASPELGGGMLRLTLVLDRTDGIERVALRCAIAGELLGGADEPDPETLLAQLAPWLEAQFEQLREAALRSIRSERRLLEVAFDSANRGPFHAG